MSAEWAACEQLRGRYHRQHGTGRLHHNHTTRDIQPRGECPACDDYHAQREQR